MRIYGGPFSISCHLNPQFNNAYYKDGNLTSMDPIVWSHSPENIDHEILADYTFLWEQKDSSKR